MHVHRSNRLEPLARRLAEIAFTPSASPGIDVWRPEIIVVPSRGVERWVSQELADQLGAAAHIVFPFPARFFGDAIAAVLGEAQLGSSRSSSSPPTDPFAPAELVFHVAKVLTEKMDDPAFDRLRGYVHAGDPKERTLDLAGAIARVFDRYAVYRPDMLLEWGDGLGTAEALRTKRLGGRGSAADPGQSGAPSLFGHGGGEDPEPDRRWQRALFRELVRTLGPAYFAARAKRAIDAIRASHRSSHRPPRPAGLPERASLFGIASLPPLHVELLEALSPWVDLHLFVLSPSKEHWAYLRSKGESYRQGRFDSGAHSPAHPAPGDLDPAADVGHPLLASFGRTGREFQAILEERAQYQEDARDLYVDPALTSDLAPASRPPTLLEVIQSDVLSLRRRGSEAPRISIAPGDRSIEVHACHSPMREVEALHGVLLEALDSDPSLDPDDIVAFVPDASTYAPFIDAVFGGGAEETGASGERAATSRVPFRIVGRDAARTGPRTAAFFAALDLVKGRMSAPDVTDLLAREPIRRRFGLGDRDLVLLRRLVAEANVRWGIDEAHRASEGRGRDRTGTWRFGLDRLFLGVAVGGHDPALFQGCLPAAGGARDGIVPLRALSEFHEVLVRLRDLVTTPKTAAAHARGFLAAFDAITGSGGTRNGGSPDATLDAKLDAKIDAGGERKRLASALSAAEDAAARAHFDAPIAFSAFVRLLASSLAESPAAPLGGGITFAPLGMLRGVPFKRIAILGMDEATFPRRGTSPAFDETQRARRSGDRTVKDDDRYAFLEALLAATERVVVFYGGLRAGDRADLAPSICVTELLEAIAWTTTSSPAELRARLVVRHPLQPFSARYFTGREPRLATYQPTFAAAARALASTKSPAPRLFAQPLRSPPAARTASIALDDLIEFYRNPAKRLFRTRLDITYDAYEDALDAGDPMLVSALERVGLGERVLEVVERGGDLVAALMALRAEGALPPGTLGEFEWRALARGARAVASRALALGGGEAAIGKQAVAISVRGVRLEGTVSGLSPSGLVVRRFGAVRGRDKLAAFIRHLALDAAGIPVETFLVGLGGKNAEEGTKAYRFRHARDSKGDLDVLVALYQEGLRGPIPFFPETSHEFARRLDPDAPYSNRSEEVPMREVDETLAPLGVADWLHTPLPPAVDMAPPAVWDAARATFDGGKYARGERNDPYVKRAFAGTEPVTPGARLPWPGAKEFSALARAVYVPLLDHLDSLEETS